MTHTNTHTLKNRINTTFTQNIKKKRVEDMVVKNPKERENQKQLMKSAKRINPGKISLLQHSPRVKQQQP